MLSSRSCFFFLDHRQSFQLKNFLYTLTYKYTVGVDLKNGGFSVCFLEINGKSIEVGSMVKVVNELL